MLKWNPSEFDGIERIVLPPSSIWVPTTIGLENRYVFGVPYRHLLKTVSVLVLLHAKYLCQFR